jgi:hypothetical protein
MQLDKQALVDEWDTLESLWAKGRNGEALTLAEMDLYPFAIMVIMAEGTVPTYRRTREQMVKSWGVVRNTFDATPAELADAVKHLMESAQNPFTPGAVKRFSERRIPQMRHKPVQTDERGATNRWQGSHGAHEDAIAQMTDEEKRRFGVIS